MMFSSSSSSYNSQFPQLEKHIDPQSKVVTKPYVHGSITLSGQLEKPKPFEIVLNWQSQNVRAQNTSLEQIHTKVDAVATQIRQTSSKVDSIATQPEKIYADMERRVVQLDHDLRSMIQNHIWGPEFNQKEAEIRKLKAELARIDAEKQQPLLTKSPSLPLQPLTFSTYQPFYTPSTQKTTEYAKHFGLTHILYQTPIQTRPKKP